MKYENEIFKILCALSLMMILSIIFINKCNAQTFVDTTQQNKNIILEEFTGIGCVWCPAGHLIGQQLHDNNILGREWKCDFIDLPKGMYIINHNKIFKTQ